MAIFVCNDMKTCTGVSCTDSLLLFTQYELKTGSCYQRNTDRVTFESRRYSDAPTDFLICLFFLTTE